VSDKGNGMFPIMAVITDEVTGREFLSRHTLAGSATGVPGESPHDLVNVPETEEAVAYVNLAYSFTNKLAAQREHPGWPVLKLALEVGIDRGLEDVRSIRGTEVVGA